MYFIGYGTIVIKTLEGHEFAHLEDGDYFGEICLFFPDNRRKSNAISIDYCELFRFDRKDFMMTVFPYQNVYRWIKMKALNKLDELEALDAAKEEEKKLKIVTTNS